MNEFVQIDTMQLLLDQLAKDTKNGNMEQISKI